MPARARKGILPEAINMEAHEVRKKWKAAALSGCRSAGRGCRLPNILPKAIKIKAHEVRKCLPGQKKECCQRRSKKERTKRVKRSRAKRYNVGVFEGLDGAAIRNYLTY
jgi:hypothetical protein